MAKGVKKKQNVMTVSLSKKQFSAGGVARGSVNLQANAVRTVNLSY